MMPLAPVGVINVRAGRRRPRWLGGRTFV